mmetsp:Transcript_9986/g.17503  ORF Transcript_9986/g.17503 Transcript_9986/m.17503 type:complete len:341 (-) Transcript_9986:351-1373(-)
MNPVNIILQLLLLSTGPRTTPTLHFATAQSSPDGYCTGYATPCSSIFNSITCTDSSIQVCPTFLETCQVTCERKGATNYNPPCRCRLTPLGCSNGGGMFSSCDNRITCEGYANCGSLTNYLDCEMTRGCEWSYYPTEDSEDEDTPFPSGTTLATPVGPIFGGPPSKNNNNNPTPTPPISDVASPSFPNSPAAIAATTPVGAQPNGSDNIFVGGEEGTGGGGVSVAKPNVVAGSGQSQSFEEDTVVGGAAAAGQSNNNAAGGYNNNENDEIMQNNNGNGNGNGGNNNVNDEEREQQNNNEEGGGEIMDLSDLMGASNGGTTRNRAGLFLLLLLVGWLFAFL